MGRTKSLSTLDKARRTCMRGFLSIFVPLKDSSLGSKGLDPNTVLNENVKNKLYSMTDLVEELPEEWPLEKRIAHIESITGTPLIDAQQYREMATGRDVVGVVHSMKRDLTRFVASPAFSKTKPVLVVWVQGTIRDTSVSPPVALGPNDTVARLKMDLPVALLEQVGEFFANSWTGSSPVQMLADVNAGKPVPQVFWTKNVAETTSDYSLAWWALQDALTPTLNPLKQYVYKQANGLYRTYDDLLRHVMQWIRESTSVSGESPAGGVDSRRYVQQWWEQPVAVGVRWHMGRHPIVPLDVQFCRQWSHGLAYTRGFPQVVPLFSLQLPGEVNAPYYGHMMAPDEGREMAQQYMNYDPHVVMTLVDQDMNKYWTPHVQGGWRILSHNEWLKNTSLLRYDVEDKTYCYGWGSIIVAWHSSLGVGSSVAHTIIRNSVKAKYKQNGVDVDVSGHIIHALLAHFAHYEWAMFELAYNLLYDKTIYLPTFSEQKTGRYHTITDYRAGLDAAAEFQLPLYAERRIVTCRFMLDFIERVVPMRRDRKGNG